jgi:hypothetical protein
MEYFYYNERKDSELWWNIKIKFLLKLDTLSKPKYKDVPCVCVCVFVCVCVCVCVCMYIHFLFGMEEQKEQCISNI